MLTLKLKGLSEARIWFEHIDSLFLKNQYDKTVTHEIESCETKFIKSRIIILELVIPTSGRVYYGVLGASYKNNATNKLLVKTHSSIDLNEFDDSRIKIREKVYVGMPDEYYEVICKGFTRGCKELGLSLSGEIDFCYAAHGVAGSSQWMFEKLAYIISGLLFIEEDQITNEVVINLLDQSKVEYKKMMNAYMAMRK